MIEGTEITQTCIEKCTVGFVLSGFAIISVLNSKIKCKHTK